jgi:predicted dehydrogenase
MANPRPIRFGILGAALIAPNALIKPATEVEGAEVYAVAARDPARASEFAKTNNIPKVHATYRELLADPEIDVIYNPLPNSLHCEWSIAALRAGKPVLCEKPIASNASEAEQMARVAKETGQRLGEAFHYRYHPLADRVREIVQGGALGQLQHVEATFCVPIPSNNIRYDWKLAGGASMDLGCYPLHMIRYFSGSMPKVIGAKAKTGPDKIDVEMDVEMKLANGASARMRCAMTSDNPITITFEARGDSGELKVVNPVVPQMGNQITLKTAEGEKVDSIKGDATYTYQLRAFIKAMRGEGEFPTDAEDGVINMRVIDDVYRAAGLPIRGT